MMPGRVALLRAARTPSSSGSNASIGFDWRLGPYDVAQSRAHATMLAAAGIIADADRDALLRRARDDPGESSIGLASFRFRAA